MNHFGRTVTGWVKRLAVTSPATSHPSGGMPLLVETRYDAALAAAFQIVGLPPDKSEAARLAHITYLVLDAIYRGENYPVRDGELFYCLHCPRCLRHYRISTSLQGRPVTCLDCGGQWQAPAPDRRRP